LESPSPFKKKLDEPNIQLKQSASLISEPLAKALPAREPSDAAGEEHIEFKNPIKKFSFASKPGKDRAIHKKK